MLHREDQVYVKAQKYDIVKAKKSIRVLPGTMNSYNKSIEHKDFNGYGIVLDASDSFAQIYLPNRLIKLIKKDNLIVEIKFNKKCKFKT
jgi:hypothetical protein